MKTVNPRKLFSRLRAHGAFRRTLFKTELNNSDDHEDDPCTFERKGQFSLAKSLSKKKRKDRRSFETSTIIPFNGLKFKQEREYPSIKALNVGQANYLASLNMSSQVVVIGPAGTGKTWIAATYASDLYRRRQISKIILTPQMSHRDATRIFPGSLEDKFSPWAVPIVEAIKERIGKAAYEIALRHGDIEMAPFEVMRGRTWKGAFVLLDEAQNATTAELKTFLTRIGEDCVTVINGDVSQCDLDSGSGLSKIITMIRNQKLPVPIVEFTVDDIVRSGSCGMWVRAFEDAHL